MQGNTDMTDCLAEVWLTLRAPRWPQELLEISHEALRNQRRASGSCDVAVGSMFMIQHKT